MELTYNQLERLATEYGDSFYLLDSKLFEENYHEMLQTFQNYYADTHIAYSYKTNYTPKLCTIIDRNGGYAEVVSEMEMWLALKLGVNPAKIYYNGPYKKKEYIEKLMLLGGHVHIDSDYEKDYVIEIAGRYPDKEFCVGIRCCLDIDQEEPSRFGYDVPSGAFEKAVCELNELPNLSVTGLHCHLPFRFLDSFKDRVDSLERVLNVMPDYNWSYISLGGGYMGKISDEFAGEFSFAPPTFEDYAKVVAGGMSRIFGNAEQKPALMIEPGSALVANTMQYVTRVMNIKKNRDKYIATLSGSTYNMNPSVKGVKRPIKVYSKQHRKNYEALDMAGYTCIEGDYLYRNYKGYLAAEDFVVFHNVGSYSVVMKPPFILPDVPVLELQGNEVFVVKRRQNEESIFMDFA